MNQIQDTILASINNQIAILADEELLLKVQEVSQVITAAFQAKRKVLICGNGGSAADAQHLAAEFSGRFYFDRAPLFAEALHVNSSYLTAVANDYGYEQIYSRMVQAKGCEGDILIGMSSSGNSLNVIEALKQGKEKGMINIAMTGHNGGKMKFHADYCLAMPSVDTPRIQECHMLLGHIICQIVEENLFRNKELKVV